MIKTIMQRGLEAIWYQRHWGWICLSPFALLFQQVVRLRRFAYQQHWLKTTQLPVPVVIVGNLTVGGTGKTPMIIYLAKCLRQAGFAPGIISRGYGGQSSTWPCRVTATSLASEVGDEAVVIAKRTGCPVVVGPERAAAAKLLLQQADCDIILSDDGLQHYALARTLELVIIDGVRRFGNNRCLPAGPLREPLSRLAEVDLVVVNGEADASDAFSLQVQATVAVNLLTEEQQPLSVFAGQKVHAVAAIGHPQRFFTTLQTLGIDSQNYAFPDHHPFSAADLQFNDNLPVLMTEKDAVKCMEFASKHFWYVPIQMQPDAKFEGYFLTLLQEKLNG